MRGGFRAARDAVTRELWFFAAAAAGYFALARLASLWNDDGQVLVFWPAAGVGLGLAGLTTRRASLVAVVAGVALGEAVSVGFFYRIAPLHLDIGTILANSVEAAVAGVVFLRLRRDATPDEPRGLAALTAAAAVGAATGAAVITPFIVAEAADAPFRWFVGDGLGLLLVAPVFWLRQMVCIAGTTWRLAAAAAVLTMAATIVVGAETDLPVLYLSFPALLWLASRFGGRAAVPAVVLSLIWVNLRTAAGAGPFVHDHIADPVFVQQIYAAAAALVTFVAVVRASHRYRLTARTERLLATAVEGVVEVDRYGVILDCNDRYLLHAGKPRDELIGQPVLSVFGDQYPDGIEGHAARFRHGDGEMFEFSAMGDRGRRWFIVSTRPSVGADGVFQGGYILTTEVTLLRRAELENRTLRERLGRVEDEERQRLAEHLHDGPLQDLVAADLTLDLARSAGDSPEMEHIHRLIRKAIGDLRSTSVELFPPDISEGALVPALRLTGTTLFGDAFRLDADLGEPVVGEQAHTVYLVAREAMRNAAKHARASEVRVRLREHRGGIELVVEDDGRGITERDRHGRPDSLGIRSMLRRAADAGGWCRVEPTGSGTCVRCWLPLHRDADLDDASPRTLTADPA